MVDMLENQVLSHSDDVIMILSVYFAGNGLQKWLRWSLLQPQLCKLVVTLSYQLLP